VDVQGRGGVGHSRRTTAGRLRGCPPAAVRRGHSLSVAASVPTGTVNHR
jgi:hypothetical protein